MQHHGGGAAPPPPPPPPPPSGGVYAQPPQQQPNDGIPYIGSRISLISKTDIRYEGFLFNIDTRQSMVALQHVRSFGTEGRRTEHIPPLDQILPFATFKASEIKDLHVCEAAPPVYGYGHPPPPPPMPHMPAPPLPPQHHAPPPPPPSAPAPPAPRQPTAPPASPPKKAPSPPTVKPSTGPTLLTPGSVSQAAKQPASPQVHVQHASSPAPQHAAAAQRSGGSRTIPGMGDHLLKRRERRVPGGGDPTSVTSGNDFNFENGLNDFDKEEEFNKLSLDDNKAKGSYQKSSFFDTISCDALDRLEGKQGRITASEERKLNTETFGAVGLNNRRSFRGGRGGGRGGGRRGGGGGGRGGRGGNNNRNGSWNRNGGGRRDGNLP
ncbi:hypothetical protein Poli38472_011503 [Pythium oligandrum]|uniref:DFDF domain-containing protein n=1 Tax=Pythium oligandrum TaxID=41045 RepID=A0A8K1CKG8_PYTOL|nr:hypothetical protein Poli38472_011503 [Pythium oligandrum]|eukprot:TMW64623.1 hypothetical protein Poli38472_011503 [Pythium oligandrum]